MIVRTCKPLHNIKELYFFPMIQMVFGLSLIVLFALVICWNFSIGTIKYYKNSNVPNGEANKIEYTSSESGMLAYNALMSAWWLSFLVDMGSFVLAGGVSIWYFSREKNALYVIFIQKPLIRSLRTCLRYHIGSIALGSILNPLSIIPSAIIKPFEKMKLKAREPIPK